MKDTIQFPIAELKAFRKQGDPLADKTIQALFALGFNPYKNKDYAAYNTNGQTIPESFPDILKNYFIEVSDLTVDQELAAKGQAFFGTYGQSIMLCLGLYSLPYCYGAAHGAKVLAFSERILNNPEKRLRETAEFVLDLHAPHAFKENGKAIVTIAKVRLIHAAIRYHLLQGNEWKQEWGYPINQMDMAGTNYSFSLIVNRGLRKLGFTLSPQQAEDYILFWNQIGRLLGLDEKLMPKSNQEAFVLEEKIRKDQFRPSMEGKALTKALMDYIDAQPTPFPMKGSQLSAYLMGEEISQFVGLQAVAESSILRPLRAINAIQQLFDQQKRSFSEIKKALLQQNNEPDAADHGFHFMMSLVGQ